MKTLNAKKTAIRALFVGLIICLVFALLPMAINAKAEKDYTPSNNVATNGFYMEEGASVRLFDKDGKQGIRFATYVEKGFYDYIVKTYGESGITFHTLVNYDGLDITEITPANSQDIVLNANVSFDGDQEDSLFMYKASIIYNGASAEGVTEEVKRAAYSVELTARAYVETGDGTIIYAVCNDTARSIKGVASAYHLIETEQSNFATIENYMVEESKTVGAVDTTVSGYYGEKYVGSGTYDAEAYAKGGVLKINGVEIVEAYMGAKKLTLTDLGDGKVAISGYEFDESEIDGLGKDVVITAFGSDGNAYRVTHKLATKILTVKEDLNFKVTSKTDAYPGLYVLGNDIDATGYVPVSHTDLGNRTASDVIGLVGTFDGNGYSISNLNFSNAETDDCSLFSHVSRGTIKNLAIKNAVISGTQKFKSLFGVYAVGLNMQNVYVDLNIQSSGNFTGGLFYQFSYVYENVLKNCVFNVNSVATTAMFYLGSLTGEPTVPDTKNWSNVYIISNIALANKFSESKVLDAEYVDDVATGTVANIKRYTSLKEMMKSTANDYSDFKGVWKLVEGVPVWHDAVVTKTLDKQFAYSQSESKLIVDEDDEIYGFTAIESATAGYTAELTDGAVIIKKAGDANFTATGEVIDLVAKKGDVNYRFAVKVATLAIDQASDLAIFNLKADATTTFPGYYMLANNIDCIDEQNGVNYVHGAHDVIPTVSGGLTGTFDGNGYTITDLKVTNGNGLFGAIVGGTIKNVAFVNAKNGTIGGNNKYNGLFAFIVKGVTFENVYVDVEVIVASAWNGALFYQAMSANANFNNCIIKSLLTAKGSSHNGSIMGESGSIAYLRANNTYVISETPLYTNAAGSIVKDASGVTAVVGTTPAVIMERYASVAEMNAAILAAQNKDARLSAFSSEFWTTDATTGAITFKTK